MAFRHVFAVMAVAFIIGAAAFAVYTNNLEGLSSLTGNLVFVGKEVNVNTASTFVSTITILLTGLVLAYIMAGMIFEGLSATPIVPKSLRLGRLIKKGINALESRDYYGAHRSYSDAKKLYASLSEASKLEHYNGLIELYTRLEHYYKSQEASFLAEKYSKGEITESERRRLNELLSE